MEQNIYIFDFALSDAEMDTIATLDTGHNLLFNHYDGEVTRMFMGWR